MKRVLRFLPIVCLAEALFVAAWWLPQLQRPVFPASDASLVDGMTQEGIERLRSGMSIDEASDWSRLGEAYLAYGSYREAEACYRRAVELRPGDVDDLYGRGMCMERLGYSSEAMELFRDVEQTAAASLRAEAGYRIGRNLLREENAVEAEQTFRRLAGFLPADHQRAKLLVRLGRAEEARPLVEELVRTGPEVIQINQVAERCFQALGDIEHARESRRRQGRSPRSLATVRSPFRMSRRQFGASRRLMEAVDLERGGRSEEALQAYAEVLASDPTEQVSLKIAAMQVHVGRPDLAVETCREQVARGGASAAVLAALARALSRMNRNEQAIACWERAIAILPRAEFCRELASAYDRHGDAEQARQQRGLAAALEGVRSYRSHDIAQAREQLAAALQLTPDYAPAWYYLGRINQMEDDVAGAAGAFARCVALNPGHGRAYAALRRMEKRSDVLEEPAGGDHTDDVSSRAAVPSVTSHGAVMAWAGHGMRSGGADGSQ